MLLLFVSFCLTAGLTAQCDVSHIRRNFEFEEAADYRKADAAAMAAIDWLLQYPVLNHCESSRNELNAFVLVWLSGHPDLRVDVKTETLPYLRTFPELLFPTIFGMAKYLVHTKNDEQDTYDAHVAGIEAALGVLNGEKQYRKDDELKKLRKLARKGRLRSFVESQLN